MKSHDKQIVVLGPNGMLGQMAVSYFRQAGYRVIEIGERFTTESYVDYVEKIKSFEDAIVINAIGRIVQKTTHLEDLLWANATLPLVLSTHLPASATLVHPSTDCVFSGKTGPYESDAEPDAMDPYGWSKRLGETAVLKRPNTLVLRVSIIGPDQNDQPRGLLGWFLSQPDGASLKGFTDHYWNGITTLEWCKQVDFLLQHPLPQHQARFEQLGTVETWTKYDMLKLFAETFGKRVHLSPFDTGQKVNKCLVPSLKIKNLKEQLLDLIK